MKKSNEFRDYALDLLGGISGITSKAMFGGHGIYRNGKIFAIIADDELYFKAGEESKEFFEAEESHPFTYKRMGKTYRMNYWLVPEKIMEDREKFAEWVDIASVNQAKI